MGYLVKMKCPTCKREETFPLGYGRNDIDAAAPKVLVYCERCNTFQALTDGMSCECGATTTVVYNDAARSAGKKEIICPKCKDSATISIEGFWD